MVYIIEGIGGFDHLSHLSELIKKNHLTFLPAGAYVVSIERSRGTTLYRVIFRTSDVGNFHIAGGVVTKDVSMKELGV